MRITQERLNQLINNRWLVFVACIWIQSCAGVGYLFGSISPAIKASMGYNQKQISYLGVAKNLGDCVGFIAGALSEFMPFWGILSIGALQNFFGYGFLWLLVTKRLPILPLWVLCVAIFVGNNGETYYNTAAVVSCVQNFPESRGPIVGILKGFSGLSGAILSQIYHMFNAQSQSSLILLIAVGPSAVVLSLMFVIRYVEGHRQKRASDVLSFSFVYSVCILLAAYLTGLLLLDDLTKLSQSWIIFSSVIMMVMLLLPLVIPIILTFFSEVRSPSEESLLSESMLTEAESEAVPVSYHDDRLMKEPADGAMIVKSKLDPQLGESFTLLQALVNADFWLIFASLVLASGSGITIIDNMGQIFQSLELSDSRIFVAMISIWNFLGRVGGGYFSELVVRKYAYPRLVALAAIQLLMAVGLMYYAIEGPAAVYMSTLVIGFGYGAHWGIAPAAISEIFGLKSFGALYNVITVAMPVGSFIFSTGLASSIYDYYAAKQNGEMKQAMSNSNIIGMQLHDDSLTCMGSVCYTITCGILSGVVLIASVLSLIVVQRTRPVYANLYANSLS